MTNDTTENFWKAWNQIETEIVPQPLEYRLYYDDMGFPLFYSTEEKPGNYMVVSKDFYTRPPKHIRIIDGKIRVYQHTTVKKLVPNTHGQCCDPRDVCVVVNDTDAHVKWAFEQTENCKHYDLKN